MPVFDQVAKLFRGRGYFGYLTWCQLRRLLPRAVRTVNRLADLLQPEDPLVYGGEVLHAV